MGPWFGWIGGWAITMTGEFSVGSGGRRLEAFDRRARQHAVDGEPAAERGKDLGEITSPAPSRVREV